MIGMFLDNSRFSHDVREELKRLELSADWIELSQANLSRIYSEETSLSILITHAKVDFIPTKAWFDLLDGLSRRMQILLICHDPAFCSKYRGRLEKAVWMSSPSVAKISSLLSGMGLLKIEPENLRKESVPTFNPLLATHMLQQNGSLSVISIHTSDFRKVAIEYGSDAYRALQKCFQLTLYNLWGMKGSFRRRDVLSRSGPNSNTYYIMLERSRTSHTPLPGDLEKLSDRLAVRLENLLWKELFKPMSERTLPHFLHDIPKFSLGHATAIYNPCVDTSELIEELFETSKKVSLVQGTRNHDRHRELMQTLICNTNLMLPHYQGVFTLKNITKQELDDAKEGQTLRPLAKHIYAFESLIRINEQEINQLLREANKHHIDVRFLKPDVLFKIAKNVNLTLELDQACLKLAVDHFQGIPGKLLANILPRNFYHVDVLRHLFESDVSLVFEVSETEAINNFGLLKSAREKLGKNFFIAIDDFGRGFAGLERILQIEPDIIKLDRSLIVDIHLDSAKRAFVEGLVKAARVTKAVILAEGVEQYDELLTLQQLNVDLIQGFLLHKPQSAQKIQEDLPASLQHNLDTVA